MQLQEARPSSDGQEEDGSSKEAEAAHPPSAIPLAKVLAVDSSNAARYPLDVVFAKISYDVLQIQSKRRRLMMRLEATSAASSSSSATTTTTSSSSVEEDASSHVTQKAKPTAEAHKDNIAASDT